MGLVSITANYECDKCGEVFKIFLPETFVEEHERCLFDVAESFLSAHYCLARAGKYLCTTCSGKILDQEEEKSEDTIENTRENAMRKLRRVAKKEGG